MNEDPSLPPVSELKEASSHTVMFILNAAAYTLLVVLTAIYCYARLDFVRSYDTKETEQSSKK